MLAIWTIQRAHGELNYKLLVTILMLSMDTFAIRPKLRASPTDNYEGGKYSKTPPFRIFGKGRKREAHTVIGGVAIKFVK